jgi:hypothetical protein
MVLAGLMGLLLLSFGALGLWRTVQPQRLSLSQRLLVMPVSLLSLILGSFMVFMAVDQEDVARMLVLPLFGSIGLLLAIGGPWLLLRSETRSVSESRRSSRPRSGSGCS